MKNPIARMDPLVVARMGVAATQRPPVREGSAPTDMLCPGVAEPYVRALQAQRTLSVSMLARAARQGPVAKPGPHAEVARGIALRAALQTAVPLLSGDLGLVDALREAGCSAFITAKTAVPFEVCDQVGLQAAQGFLSSLARLQDPTAALAVGLAGPPVVAAATARATMLFGKSPKLESRDLDGEAQNLAKVGYYAGALIFDEHAQRDGVTPTEAGLGIGRAYLEALASGASALARYAHQVNSLLAPLPDPAAADLARAALGILSQGDHRSPDAFLGLVALETRTAAAMRAVISPLVASPDDRVAVAARLALSTVSDAPVYLWRSAAAAACLTQGTEPIAPGFIETVRVGDRSVPLQTLVDLGRSATGEETTLSQTGGPVTLDSLDSGVSSPYVQALADQKANAPLASLASLVTTVAPVPPEFNDSAQDAGLAHAVAQRAMLLAAPTLAQGDLQRTLREAGKQAGIIVSRNESLAGSPSRDTIIALAQRPFLDCLDQGGDVAAHLALAPDTPTVMAAASRGVMTTSRQADEAPEKHLSRVAWWATYQANLSDGEARRISQRYLRAVAQSSRQTPGREHAAATLQLLSAIKDDALGHMFASAAIESLAVNEWNDAASLMAHTADHLGTQSPDLTRLLLGQVAQSPTPSGQVARELQSLLRRASPEAGLELARVGLESIAWAKPGQGRDQILGNIHQRQMGYANCRHRHEGTELLLSALRKSDDAHVAGAATLALLTKGTPEDRAAAIDQAFLAIPKTA